MNSSPDQLPEKPRPISSPENQVWWQALTEHRLLAQCCSNCKKKRLYPRPMCEKCYSLEFDWVELSGDGTVHSWTVAHHAFNPAFKRELPYVTVTVDLGEDLRLHAPLRDANHNDLAIGMSVCVGFDDIDDTYSTLFFRPKA